jgi:hypothetical protein
MKNNKTFEDDNRVVADMNFEGAPWYRKKNSMNVSGQNGGELSKKETFYVMRNAIVAGLAVALVFILAAFVFIMFSLEVWFK